MIFQPGPASGLEGILFSNYLHINPTMNQFSDVRLHLLFPFLGVSRNHFGGMRAQ